MSAWIGDLSFSVAEEPQEGQPEQKIFDAAPKELWNFCTISALFPLEVGATQTVRTSPFHGLTSAWLDFCLLAISRVER